MRQVRWSCIPISWRIFLQFVVIHTVKVFGVVNKAKVDVFLELSFFFNDPTDVGNLISVSSAFSKTSLNIWKFTIHVLLKPWLENFEHYFSSVWDECNCAVVWILFSIAFLWDWNENWPFPVPWPLQMEYYSIIKRTAFESVLMRWMNLEPIIQSEVSQKEKNKYCMLTHIHRI